MTTAYIAAARNFGARVRMTRSDHLSGTDRVAEVASAENAEIIVNIQGDEPLIDPAAIDAAILPLVHDPELAMGTLKKRIEDRARNHRSQRGEGGDGPRRRRDLFLALRRFRSTGKSPSTRLISSTSACTFTGAIFCWRIPTLPVGPLEQAERLEQLRALENGFRIRVVETEYESLGVDTPEDLERVSRLVRRLNFTGNAKWLNTSS